MANVDRPNGFKPVKTLNGDGWEGTIRAIGVADSADIFIGDPINLESGLAAPGAAQDVSFLGVAVGFGKFATGGRIPVGPFNPADLEQRFYDDSESTHTEWVCYYVPAENTVFEAQTDTALTLVVGSLPSLTYTAGNTTTGRSACELTTSANGGDFEVIEVPNLPDNDPTAVWGRYWVMFREVAQAFHA